MLRVRESARNVRCICIPRVRESYLCLYVLCWLQLALGYFSYQGFALSGLFPSLLPFYCSLLGALHRGPVPV